MTLAKLLVAIGATTSAYHRAMARVRGDLNATERRAHRFGKTFRTAGDGLRSFARNIALIATVGVIALSGALAGSVKAAVAWEDAFAGVRKTVEASEPEFRALERGIRDLATTLPIAASELAALAETAGALGIAKENILEFTRVTALLGITTDVTALDAATALGQLSNVLGLTGADYERFASTLVDLGNKGASTESQILGIASRAGAAAKLIDLSTSATLGWSSAVASLGIEVEAGGSSLQTFFLRTAKITGKGGSKLTAMAKIAGTTAKKFKTAFGKDANGALVMFLRGLGKLDKAQRILALDKLGLDDIRLTRTILGLADSIDRNLVPSLETANAAWEKNNALQVEAAKRIATAKSQWQLLKNTLYDIGITLGSVLLPRLTPLIEKLRDFIATHQPKIENFAIRLGRAFDDAWRFAAVLVDKIDWTAVRGMLRAIADSAGDVAGQLGPAFIAAVVSIPWSTIGDVFKVGAGFVKEALRMFSTAPDWLKTAVVTGWGLNKLTGGNLAKGLFGAIGDQFFARGASAANPMWVASVGGVGGGKEPGGPPLVPFLPPTPVLALGVVVSTILTGDTPTSGNPDLPPTPENTARRIFELERRIESLGRMKPGDLAFPTRGDLAFPRNMTTVAEEIARLRLVISGLTVPRGGLSPDEREAQRTLARLNTMGGVSPDERQTQAALDQVRLLGQIYEAIKVSRGAWTAGPSKIRSVARLTPRAGGGPAPKGLPLLVGEERAEVFIPAQRGEIKPDAGRALDRGPTEVNHIVNLTVQGDLRARDKQEVVRVLQRAAAFAR